MSTKTTKVTDGKVLSYTVSAAGYKTLSGSKIITADETIKLNMIPESESTSAFEVGDRLGDIASFVCYFDSVDPQSAATQKYAVFVLDAKYRTASISAGPNYSDVNNWLSGMPKYSNATDALNAKESATWNTKYMTATPYSDWSISSSWPCLHNAAHKALYTSYKITSCLPNVYELQQIFMNKTILDLKDPTATTFPDLSLATRYNSTNWSSTKSTTSSYWWYVNGTNVGHTNPYSNGCIPIFEVPVN